MRALVRGIVRSAEYRKANNMMSAQSQPVTGAPVIGDHGGFDHSSLVAAPEEAP
jgi:hypothetical protein